jgi:hypothetical protein
MTFVTKVSLEEVNGTKKVYAHFVCFAGQLVVATITHTNLLSDAEMG